MRGDGDEDEEERASKNTNGKVEKRRRGNEVWRLGEVETCY